MSFNIESISYEFFVCNISQLVNVCYRRVIDKSQRLRCIFFTKYLNVSKVSNMFSHSLIPSRDFKKSAIDGSKDKVCSNDDVHIKM